MVQNSGNYKKAFKAEEVVMFSYRIAKVQVLLVVVGALLVAQLVVSVTDSTAAAPLTINYQGLLTDDFQRPWNKCARLGKSRVVPGRSNDARRR